MRIKKTKRVVWSIGVLLLGGILAFLSSSVAQKVHAVVGSLSISGQQVVLSGNIQAAKLVDVSNNAYFIDPASSGTSLTTAGSVGIATTTITEKFNIAGNIGFSGGPKIKDSAGVLQLQAGGTTGGAGYAGNIDFLDSTGVRRSRIETIGTGSGTGADGPLTVSTSVKTDGTKTGVSTTSNAAQAVVSVTSTTGFAGVNEVLIIQMTGTGAGNYETKKISSVGAGTLTMTANLTNTYTNDGSSKAQVIKVPNYTAVTVSSGGTITADAWNGTIGGIVMFRATGTVNVNSGGTITVANLGSTGGTGGGGGTAGAASGGGGGGAGATGCCCVAGTNGTGGAGGGGGSGGLNGSYGGTGGTGGTGGGGTAGNAGNGSGGGAANTGGTNSSAAALTTMYLGGGGGGGTGGSGSQGGGGGGGGGGGSNYGSGTSCAGGDTGLGGSSGSGGNTGPAGSAGGKSGGIIFIKADTITITGTLSANGQAGTNGSTGSTGGGAGSGGTGGGFGNTWPRDTWGGGGGGGKGGNGGSGSNGGGGGAGGAIYLSANTLTLGSNLATASGGSGGSAGSGGSGASGGGGATTSGSNGSTGSTGSTGSAGSAGGNGVIRLEYTSTSGTVSPTAASTGTYVPDSTGYGTFFGGATNTSSTDLAEYYISGDDNITSGDVVTMSNVKLQMTNEKGVTEEVVPKGVLRKARNPYDHNLIGIISTKPGVLMGSDDYDIAKDEKRMLALAGRVPVKIDPDSPTIAVGDFLTSSDKPGMAKKATKAGYVVARALENWNPSSPTDKIEAFISLSYYVGDIDAYGRLVTKTFDTLTVTDHIEGSDKIRGNARLEPGSQMVVINRVWEKAPVSVNVTPSYDTATYITDVSSQGFTIRVGTPPSKREELYWQAWW